MKSVAVIGGGAAGMMAAYFAAKGGARVCIFEKNEKTGKKLYITGKGRCNLTNDCDRDTFFDNMISNPRFMYSAYHNLSSTSLKELFENGGLELKTERGNRVFPVSDKSSDVIKTLNRMLQKSGVNILLNTEVLSVSKEQTELFLIRYKTGNREIKSGSFDSVIIATGGITYPATGSTGDGALFAERFGHKVNDMRGALVPLVVKEEDAPLMQGLSLKNVSVKLKETGEAKKSVYEGFGEFVFTHFGLSGPLILSASSHYVKKLYGREAYLSIDLKPTLTSEELDKRILKDFENEKNKSFKNSLDKLLPQKLIPVIIKRSGIDEEKRVNGITREERQSLAGLIKNLEFTITGTRGENEAIITQGGVSVKETDPKTMESRLVPGLYFAGEVLDVDALTGGFNLQIAWSTGALAGMSAAEE